MCDPGRTLRDVEKLLGRLHSVTARPAGRATLSNAFDDAALAVDDLLQARAAIAEKLARRETLALGEEVRLVDMGRLVDRQLRDLTCAESRLSALLVQAQRATLAALPQLF